MNKLSKTTCQCTLQFNSYTHRTSQLKYALLCTVLFALQCSTHPNIKANKWIFPFNGKSLCVYINNDWWTNHTDIESYNSSDLKYLILECRGSFLTFLEMGL